MSNKKEETRLTEIAAQEIQKHKERMELIAWQEEQHKRSIQLRRDNWDIWKQLFFIVMSSGTDSVSAASRTDAAVRIILESQPPPEHPYRSLPRPAPTGIPGDGRR